jgi:hypothetical protein
MEAACGLHKGLHKKGLHKKGLHKGLHCGATPANPGVH